MKSNCCNEPLIGESDVCSKCEEHCGVILECKRCDHTWEPRKEYPKECPQCKSYSWNTERAYQPGWVLHPEVFENIGECQFCAKTMKLTTVEDKETQQEIHICKTCVEALEK